MRAVTRWRDYRTTIIFALCASCALLVLPHVLTSPVPFTWATPTWYGILAYAFVSLSVLPLSIWMYESWRAFEAPRALDSIAVSMIGLSLLIDIMLSLGLEFERLSMTRVFVELGWPQFIALSFVGAPLWLSAIGCARLSHKLSSHIPARRAVVAGSLCWLAFSLPELWLLVIRWSEQGARNEIFHGWFYAQAFGCFLAFATLVCLRSCRGGVKTGEAR